MIDYRNIRNVADIDKERRTIRTRLSLKGNQVTSSFMTLKEDLSPANLFAEGVKSVSSIIPLDRFVLAVVRFLKNKLTK